MKPLANWRHWNLATNLHHDRRPCHGDLECQSFHLAIFAEFAKWKLKLRVCHLQDLFTCCQQRIPQAVVPRGFCTKEVPHSRKESTVLEARGGKNACSAPIKDPGCREPTVHGDDVVKKTSRKRKTCQFLMCKDIYGSFLKWWVSPHFTPQNAHF